MAACDKALSQDTTPVRRAQITLGRAIHNIEAKAYDAAIADARSAAKAAGDKALEPGYQETLGLSAREIAAAALLHKGDVAAAEEEAMQMALASPYDTNNFSRASRYATLTAQMTPAKKAYLEQLVRLLPQSLTLSASAREWTGDFVGAAQDMAALMEMRQSAWPDSPSVAEPARLALIAALMGDVAKSDQLAQQTESAMDAALKTGKLTQSDIAPIYELMDLRAIAVQLAQGKVYEARTAFAARTRWAVPWVQEVTFLSEKLRAGADPSELKGALAVEPAKARTDALASSAIATIGQAKLEGAALFAGMRPYIGPNDYASLSGGVWKIDKPRYLIAHTGKEDYQGEEIFLQGVYAPSLVPISEAALLHAALIARSRHQPGFAINPRRVRLDEVYLRFGTPGQPGFPVQSTFDAETVIAALSVKMPSPNAPRPVTAGTETH